MLEEAGVGYLVWGGVEAARRAVGGLEVALDLELVLELGGGRKGLQGGSGVPGS